MGQAQLQDGSNAEFSTPKKGILEAVDRGRRKKWLRRKGTKKSGFRFTTWDGKEINREEEIKRILALVIPPAWRYVRISPSPTTRLQVIGVDKNNRLQYIYHEKFTEHQKRKKFAKVERFAEHLPALRRITNEHIATESLTRDKVLAVITRLINELYFRVGSEDSVKRYRTYGVTTLRNRHLNIKKGQLVFNFVGKHHIRHRRILVDDELVMIMKEMKSLRGSRLFKYLDEEGKIHPIKPQDVNDYIKRATHEDFSAKDFRTWGGTLLAALELAEAGVHPEDKVRKKKLVEVIRKVAERLGNTPSIARSSYVHPTVIDRYMEGMTIDDYRIKRQRQVRRLAEELEREEIALLRLLKGKAN